MDVSSTDDAVLFAPFAAFPSDLLPEVWLFALGQSCRALPKHSLYWRHWHELRNFMMVCKQWYEVAVVTPALWRIVQFDGRVARRMTKLMLQRSGQMSLNLQVCYDDKHSFASRYQGAQESLEDGAHAKHVKIVYDTSLVEPVIRRVSSLVITVGSRLGSNEMISKGTYDAALLETLDVEYHPTVFPFDHPVPLVSPVFPLPRLRHIAVLNVAFRTFSPFFRPTITSLNIGLPPYSYGPSLFTFLHALSGMPLLVYLRTSYIFSDDAHRNPDDVLVDVKLDNLRRLILADGQVTCAEFLEHLTFQSSLLYSGNFFRPMNTGRSMYDDGDEGLDIHTRLLLVLLAKLDGQGVVGIARTPTSFGLHMHTSCFSFDVGDAPDASKPFFEHMLAVADEMDIGMKDVLHVICSTGPRSLLSGIRTLRLQRSERESESLPPSETPTFIHDMQTAFCNLETLHLDDADAIWIDVAEAHLAASSPLPFPMLKNLILKEKDLPQNILLLRDMVRIRAEAGSPLSRLELIFESEEVSSGALGSVQDDLETLRGLVEVLEIGGSQV
ncbi:hypothetical protein EIP91_009991 [Steccherinum ochraceum]|uniref:F-box domain-containing protein n=1 Tax=Steccherinum ochraceum TaxID=92696 RepID=A0A4V2MX44_9APHY|nr:hypothetical protein EIP91_009991 [Steccherinum ochraceum]